MSITKIYTNEDGSPIIYMDDSEVIDHESTDGRDYSIDIWETYNEVVEDMMYEYGIEDEDPFTEEDIIKAWEWTLDAYADCGVEIIARRKRQQLF